MRHRPPRFDRAQPGSRAAVAPSYCRSGMPPLQKPPCCHPVRVWVVNGDARPRDLPGQFPGRGLQRSQKRKGPFFMAVNRHRLALCIFESLPAYSGRLYPAESKNLPLKHAADPTQQELHAWSLFAFGRPLAPSSSCTVIQFAGALDVTTALPRSGACLTNHCLALLPKKPGGGLPT